MHAPVAPEINRLIDLIDYVEATERDKLKTVLDYQDHKAFRKTGAELQGLPGVALDVAVMTIRYGCVSTGCQRRRRQPRRTLSYRSG